MIDVDVLVVGGGISGLATAWWLAGYGLSVQVWESDQRAGGKIHTDIAGGYITERAASLVMKLGPEVDRLISETGLEGAKIPGAPMRKRYLVHEGRLVALPMTMGAMLASRLWSARGTLRLALEPFIPRGGHDRETVSEFTVRRLGRELLDRAMEPFVAGTLASDPEQANAYATLPRLTALERRYGSLGAGVLVNKLLRRRSASSLEAFSFHGGMSALVAALEAASGTHFRGSHTVTELCRNGTGWRVTASNGRSEQTLRARRVVLSIPADAAAALLAPLDAELGELLRGIDYAPLAVAHLGLPRSAVAHPLDGTGFLTPRRAGVALNGCLWASSLFANRAPPGKVLLSAYLGGARSPQAVDWADRRTLDAVLSVLAPLLGISGAPEMVRIDRHRRGLPLYHGAYQGRLEAMDARLRALPGLYLAANYQDGVSVRNRIVCAHAVARRICSGLGHRASERRDEPKGCITCHAPHRRTSGFPAR